MDLELTNQIASWYLYIKNIYFDEVHIYDICWRIMLFDIVRIKVSNKLKPKFSKQIIWW